MLSRKLFSKRLAARRCSRGAEKSAGEVYGGSAGQTQVVPRQVECTSAAQELFHDAPR